LDAGRVKPLPQELDNLQVRNDHQRPNMNRWIVPVPTCAGRC